MKTHSFLLGFLLTASMMMASAAEEGGHPLLDFLLEEDDAYVCPDYAPITHGEGNIALPPEIAAYLEEHLPAWTPVGVEDYEEYLLKYWDEYNISFNYPGDFDGNGMEDLAVLLKNAAGAVGLMVIAVHEEGLRHYVLSERVDELPTRTSLSRQEPGVTRVSMGDEIPVRTREFAQPSIVTSLMETCGHSLFYWEDGAFHDAYRGL